MDAKTFPLIVVLSVTSQECFVTLDEVLPLASHLEGRPVELSELPALSNLLRLKLLKRFSGVSDPHIYAMIRKIRATDNLEQKDAITTDLVAWMSKHLELKEVGLIPIRPDPDPINARHARPPEVTVEIGT